MSTYYRSLIQSISALKSGLIAAYKFESNGNDSYASFNGSVGSSVSFSSTNAVDGLAGQFISNTNSRIIINDDNAFSFTNGTTDLPFSIKANIYSNNKTTVQPIFSKWNGTNNNTSEYMLYTRAPTGRLALLLLNKNAGGGYIGLETVNVVVNGNLNNIVVTYDGSATVAGVKMYVNGVLQSLNNFSSGSYVGMGNTSLTPIIGNRSSGNSPFIGTIDELYVFNAELTQVQVTALQSNYYPNF